MTSVLGPWHSTDRLVGFRPQGRQEITIESIPYLDDVGVEIEHWSPGNAVVGLEIKPRHLNRSGVVHGGLYSVLADAAGGLAGCYSEAAPVRAYTVTLTTSFLDRACAGRLRAEGVVMRHGARMYFANVDISCDGRRVAIAQGSFMLAEQGNHGR